MIDTKLSGLIVVLKGQTTLPWWSYLVALILGAFITVCPTVLSRFSKVLTWEFQAFLYFALCTYGKWCSYEPVDENGRGSHQPGKTSGQPLLQHVEPRRRGDFYQSGGGS